MAILLATASALHQRALSRRAAPPTPDATPSPEPNTGTAPRIRVEVLNATPIRGLARRATRVLRDQGFDVVDMATANEQLDTTVVVDRSGHPEWANKVAAALGGARMMMRPDTSHYLDVTVLLGRSWRPPPQPFNP
jgi:LytR cell envelope-related transcriptional attenuator